MTKNSGFPSGGSLIILYCGVKALDLESCTTSIILGSAKEETEIKSK